MTKSEDSELKGWAHTPFLAKVTDTAPNIIYIFNQQTQSNEYSNRSIGESLGYTTQEIRDMGNALFLELCHPDDLPNIGPHFGSVCQLSDGEVAQLEYRMKHKSGDWKWLLSYDTVFERNESGDVIRHLGIATDITEQKLAQEQAQAQRHATDAANEELRSFAYSVSHDMKSPSNTLQLLLCELKEQHGDSLDNDAQELLDLSLKTVGRMQAMVDDVLNYTQVVGEEIEFEDVNLNALAKDVTNDLLAEINHKGAQLLIDKLPIVRGSRTQLYMLLQNLLTNALKYQSKDSQPVVSISSTVQAHAKTTSFHVKDNGIGIAPEHQERIFEMFKRLHANNEYPGSGLGLAICKRIARRHNADITVASTVGEGATFTVSFNNND